MAEVSVRDLRNHCGRILQRVMRGETLTITANGRPVAEIRPVQPRPLSAAVLLDRWRPLPWLDATALRSDIDSVLDSGIVRV